VSGDDTGDDRALARADDAAVSSSGSSGRSAGMRPAGVTGKAASSRSPTTTTAVGTLSPSSAPSASVVWLTGSAPGPVTTTAPPRVRAARSARDQPPRPIGTRSPVDATTSTSSCEPASVRTSTAASRTPVSSGERITTDVATRAAENPSGGGSRATSATRTGDAAATTAEAATHASTSVEVEAIIHGPPGGHWGENTPAP
jgi:hypothetical protein